MSSSTLLLILVLIKKTYLILFRLVLSLHFLQPGIPFFILQNIFFYCNPFTFIKFIDLNTLLCTDLFLHLLHQLVDGLYLRLFIVVQISLCLRLDKAGAFFLLGRLILICFL